MSISPPPPPSLPPSSSPTNSNVHIDLIDFHVESPPSPKPSSAHCEITIPEECENLIDTELPILEQKLQTATTLPDSSGLITSRRSSSSIDVEDILISIESDEYERDSLDGEEVEQDTNNGNVAVVDNIEALLVLKNLDDLLNATLEESHNTENDQEQRENEREDNDENVQQVIEDCLEDLDNYLKAIDDYDSETNGSNVSDYSDEQSTTKESSGSLSELTGSHTLSESIEETKEFNEELIRNKLRQIEKNYSKFVTSGIINRGYKDTENFTVQRRPSSACAATLKSPINRKHPIRATTLAVFRKAKNRPRLLGTRRKSLDENNSSQTTTLARTSGTDAIASTPENWLVHDISNVRHAGAPPDGSDCCTGTVMFVELQNKTTSSSSTLDINELPKEEVERSSSCSSSSNWLRNSMRRIQQFNLSNTNNDSETVAATASDSSEVNNNNNNNNNVRPLSAPSRLIPHPTSSTSTVRSSRSRSRNSTTQEPNDRARSSSTSTHSQHHRSLSSSVTSLASSVESTLPTSPTTTTTTGTNRNGSNQQETNNRRRL